MKKLSLNALGRLTPEVFESLPKIPVILFADQIRSGHNIGSLFRIADAFALEGIVLSGISPTPPQLEVEKTALGSTKTVKWQKCDTFESYFEDLKKLGYLIIGVEQTDQSIPLHSFPLDVNGRYVLVFGNEVHGIRDSILPLLDHCIEIPQFGTKHSINVSVAAGIACWEFVKGLHRLR